MVGGGRDRSGDSGGKKWPRRAVLSFAGVATLGKEERRSVSRGFLKWVAAQNWLRSAVEVEVFQWA